MLLRDRNLLDGIRIDDAGVRLGALVRWRDILDDARLARAHPLLVAALQQHRAEQRMLELYDDEGFAFCTRNGTPIRSASSRAGKNGGTVSMCVESVTTGVSHIARTLKRRGSTSMHSTIPSVRAVRF